MNPENPSRDEIEIRLTALLLGELPEEEARLLRWTISQDPELAKLHDQLKHTIGLVREVSAKPAEPAELKLSEERRKKLLAHFQTPRPQESFWVKPMRLPTLIEVMVLVAIVAILAAIMLSALSTAKRRAMHRYGGQFASSTLSTEDRAKSLSNTTLSGKVATEPAPDTDSFVNNGNALGIAPGMPTPAPTPAPATPPASSIVLPQTASEAPVETGPQWTASNGGATVANTAGVDSTTGMPQADNSGNARQQVVTAQPLTGALQQRVSNNTSSEDLAYFKNSQSVGADLTSGSAGGGGGGGPISGVRGTTQATTSGGLGAGGGFGGAGGISGENRLYRSKSENNQDLATLAPPPASSPFGESPADKKTDLAFDNGVQQPPVQDDIAGAGSLGSQNSTRRIPMIGDVPVEGSLFSSKDAGTQPLASGTTFAQRLNSTELAAGDTVFYSTNYVDARRLNEGSASPAPTLSKDQVLKYHEEVLANHQAYQRELTQLQTLQSIAATNPSELRNVIPTMMPDQALSDLLGQFNDAERQLAKLDVDDSPSNVAVMRVEALKNQLNTQITNRVNGIMDGLVASVSSKKAQIDQLNEQIQAAKNSYSTDISEYQAYNDEQRQLDQLKQVHKLLYSKIKAEAIDATIPQTSQVQITDVAAPGKSQGWWERLNGEVESTSRIKVENNSGLIAGMSTPASNQTYDPYFIQTTFETIISIPVLAKVVDQMQLQHAWAGQNGGQNLTKDEAIAMLKDRLTLSPVKNTKLINITAKSDKPAESASLANAVAQAYQEYRAENTQQAATAGLSALKKSYAAEDQRIRELLANVNQLRGLNGGTMDVNDVISLYAKLTGRTILRTGVLQSKALSVPNLAVESQDEQIITLHRVLAADDISVINVGDKFAKLLAPDNASATATVSQDDRPLRQPAPNAPIPQPEFLTAQNSFSTFTMNVSDVSFKLAAASLEKGRLPEPASIRSEEFINAFDYRDPEPSAGQAIAFNSERAQDPFVQNRDLLRFSVKTAATGRQPGRPLNLVLLLDNSGSMERADRVAIIRESLRVLATQLEAQDTVTVVTFARTARLWLDGVPGNQAGAALQKVGDLTPEGGTNLEEAMRLAYEAAHRHYLANGMNRVVLLTDGAANLGNVDARVLTQKVEENRKQGIALDCFGIGWEDYNDDLLEQLSSHGDGRYAFLNSPEEASSEFAAKLAGALQIAAKDVKVQVEFNPDRVTAWRQIGYAKHQLTKEQFRDNSIAAGEIASAEAGNALYTVELKPDGTGPIATVRLRYRVPGDEKYWERSWNVNYTGNAPALEKSSAAMRLSATSAGFAEWLATSPFAQQITLDGLLNELNGVPAVYGADARPKKLEWMIRQAKSVSGAGSGRQF